MAGSQYLVLVLLLVAGAVLYGLGTLLVHSANGEIALEPQAKPEAGAAPGVAVVPPAFAGGWTAAVTGTDDALDSATRIDMIERLVLVGEPWCIAAIKAAAETDDDAAVRDAAGRVLRAQTI